MALFVNGERVSEGELAALEAEAANALAMRLPRDADAVARMRMHAEARSLAREEAIRRMVLSQDARRDPEPVDAVALEQALAAMHASYGGAAQFRKCMDITPGNEEKVREQVEADLRRRRLVARVTARAARPRQQELAEAYRRRREDFVLPEEAHAFHIVKHAEPGRDPAAARSALEAARARVLAGEPFARVADAVSDCKGNGGDLGCIQRGTMVEAFEAVVFALPLGQVSDVFETEFGHHVALVTERRPARTLSFAEARPTIEAEMLRQRGARLLEAHLDRLRRAAVIEEREEALHAEQG